MRDVFIGIFLKPLNYEFSLVYHSIMNKYLYNHKFSVILSFSAGAAFNNEISVSVKARHSPLSSVSSSERPAKRSRRRYKTSFSPQA